jgi:hypothetical protein
MYCFAKCGALNCSVLRHTAPSLQEEAESQLPGMPTQQPAAAATSRKGVHFADSVRRTEDEPCAARVSGLTTPVLVVMMASLAYLADTLQVRPAGVKFQISRWLW